MDIASIKHHALIEALKRDGFLTRPTIEEAFRSVTRTTFLPEAQRARAHHNETLILSSDSRGLANRSSTAPAITALILERAGLRKGGRVLEIGTGTGFTTALLGTLVGRAGHVVSLDLAVNLSETARRYLDAEVPAAVEVREADGWSGAPVLAPFDSIVSGADAWPLPLAWLDQLAPDGVLVAPIGGFLHAFVRKDDWISGGPFEISNFMPMVVPSKDDCRRHRTVSAAALPLLPLLPLLPRRGDASPLEIAIQSLEQTGLHLLNWGAMLADARQDPLDWLDRRSVKGLEFLLSRREPAAYFRLQTADAGQTLCAGFGLADPANGSAVMVIAGGGDSASLLSCGRSDDIAGRLWAVADEFRSAGSPSLGRYRIEGTIDQARDERFACLVAVAGQASCDLAPRRGAGS